MHAVRRHAASGSPAHSRGGIDARRSRTENARIHGSEKDCRRSATKRCDCRSRRAPYWMVHALTLLAVLREISRELSEFLGDERGIEPMAGIIDLGGAIA